MPQNLWVGISESGHSTILIFTFLKSAFQTLTFGICLGSQHLKVTLSTISTGVCAIAPILLHFENVSKSLKDLKFFSRGSLQTTQMLKFSINNRNGSENTAADGAFYTQAKKPPFSQPVFYTLRCVC